MTATTIDIALIAQTIRDECPEVAFAYLFGSAKEGLVKPGSDVDIAIYHTSEDVFYTANVAEKLEKVINKKIPVDVADLQKAGAVLAFEALSGIQLFVRDEYKEQYSDFYALTCNKYHDEMYWMKKRLEYRGYEVQWNR